jgi:hypothetical protein
MKQGLGYSLNGVGARVWATIEGSPAGIDSEGIVDVLEIHFTVVRQELERTARHCLTKLKYCRYLGISHKSDPPQPFSN